MPIFSLGADLPVYAVARRYWQEWRQEHPPDLCAFLAGQAEVSPAELAAVLRVDQRERWLRGQRVPAEEYLHQFLSLGASPEHALDVVYAEFLLREQLDETPSVADLAERFPHFAEPLRLQIELHRALAASGVGGGKSFAERPTVWAEEDRTEGAARWPVVDGYEVVGLLGRGGMGVVYRAWQARLNRPVALKMVRGGPERGEQERGRFRAEYAILARLRHPNIVQIYEAGEADGCPFFSMELVEGGGLDRLLAGRPQPPRATAELVQTLARAVHHAHGEGVIHRDLKPANVLLAPVSGRVVSGEWSQDAPPTTHHSPLTTHQPKITDFGLAKLLCQEGVERHTLSGQVMGTPCYLAPEQAAGRGQDVGPASDVYSLGAILYECLTGRPPFQGATLLETLEQVRGREPLPPRQLQPGVPRDLETICLKCLEKEPSHRYTSAAALADDLGRFLDGHPVSARPTSTWERGLKWARRRPAVAGLLLALGASLLALLGLGAWSYVNIRAALDRAEQGRRAAEEAQGEAERQTAEAVARGAEARRGTLLALEAVAKFWTQVSEEALLNRPGLEKVRRAFLKGALDFYEKAIREGGDHPEMRAARGAAYMRYARLTAKTAGLDRALELGRKGQALLAEVAQEFPRRSAYRADLASAHVYVGDLLTRTNRLDIAEAEYVKALRLYESLPADHPRAADRRNALADAHHNLALLYAGSERPRQAEEGFRKSLGIRLALVASHDLPFVRNHPVIAAYKSSLAMTLTELANLYSSTRRPKQAESPCRDALVIYRDLARAEPGSARRQLDLGRGLLSLGILLDQTRRRQPALEVLSGAVEVFGKLERRFPAMIDYRQGLAVALVNRSNVLDYLGDKQRAEAGYRRAGGLYARLVEGNPTVAEFVLGHAAAQGNLAQMLRDRGRTQEALTILVRTTGPLEKLLLAEKRYGPARALLARMYADRADLHGRHGQHAEALADWERALAGPADPRRSHWLLMRALTLARLGQHGRARLAVEKVGPPQTLLPPMRYNLACVRATCGAAALVDSQLPLGERLAQAAVHTSDTLGLLRQLQAEGYFRVPAHRELLRSDTDLDPLRLQEGFRKLVQTAEAQGG